MTEGLSTELVERLDREDVAVGDYRAQWSRFGRVTDENHGAVAELATAVVAEKKSLEAEQKTWTEPLKLSIDRMKSAFGLRLSPLKELEAELRRALGEYATELDRRKKELEDRARAELRAQEEAKRAEAARLAEAVGVPPEEMPVTPLEEYDVTVKLTESVVHTASGSVSNRRQPHVAVEDISKVPREFLVADESALKKFGVQMAKESGEGAAAELLALWGVKFFYTVEANIGGRR